MTVPPPTEENPFVDGRATFGVGCFHFELFGAPVGDDAPEQYVRLLKAHLSKYPNIEEIHIAPYRAELAFAPWLGEADLGGDHDSEYDDGDIQSAFGIDPWPVAWVYSFTLNIPSRLQAEILRRAPLGTERFRVTVHYEGELPVAIVEGIDAAVDPPSAAVILVRRYLDEYQLKDSSVLFRCVGPSPFHADFYVQFTYDVAEPPEIEIIETRSYDDVHISLRCAGADPSESIAELHRAVAHELGCFYRVIQSQSRLNLRWQGISHQVAALTKGVKNASGKGLKRKYTRDWRDRLDLVALELVSFKIEVDRVVRSSIARLDRLARSEGMDDFRRYTERELQELDDYSIDEFSTTLRLLEKRSEAEATNVTVIIAAGIGIFASLAGGVVGSLIAGLFR